MRYNSLLKEYYSFMGTTNTGISACSITYDAVVPKINLDRLFAL